MNNEIEIKKAGAVFWIRTPVALVMKNVITPEEYYNVDSIEYGNSSIGKIIEKINNINVKNK